MFFSFCSTYFDVLFATHTALYDASIAILKVETADNGRLRDLTFESGYFCDALYSYLMPKYDACFVDTPSYLKYMQDPSHKPTAIVYLNVTDVQKDFLREYVNTTGETRNRFGVLILPVSAHILVMTFCV